MSSDDLDPDLRAVRAALSQLVGYTLPDGLAAVAEANGIASGGWVFPASPVNLALPELSDPLELVPRGVELIEQAADLGVRILVPGDAGWPVGTAADDLPCLWVNGDPDVAGVLRRAVTVTGARDSTSYGEHMAGELAFPLASLGWTVVAAAGFGIDQHAAAKARAAGGRTVLVSAGSVLPDDHVLSLRSFVADAAAHGCVVSAFPPGIRATRARWAVQQRLLATVSAGTVVVQASGHSRALEVARLAAAAGRAVCAVPGPVTSEQSVGCHRLIEDGTAMLVSTGSDAARAIAGNATRHAPDRTDLFEVSGRAGWDDGVWRTRELPPFLIPAASAQQAADIAFGIAFTARPNASGATLDAAVRSPDGTYQTLHISVTS
ncbi:DNA-processing protein DprA [Catelliglobosispora koreensis]|uniref:DNA-processing protein DprA n=1 Tax=Catelliglobosispora koreensis TaxID=129052 RepID=UPI000364C330|nr:DNA-processing protein DprA [Catelliglobosispora koreensis]